MKTCSLCGVDKTLSEFYSTKENSDGHRNVCILCTSAAGDAKRKTTIAIGAPRKCNVCGETKSISEFRSSDTCRDGFRLLCISCQQTKKSVRYFTDPAPVKAYLKEYRADAENKKKSNTWHKEHRHTQVSMYILRRTRASAKLQGVPYNLTLEDVTVPDTCPVLGIPLIINTGDTSKRPPGVPSIDRVVPELGYVKGNVRIISFKANRLKNNSTLDELRALVRYVEDHAGARSDDTDSVYTTNQFVGYS